MNIEITANESYFVWTVWCDGDVAGHIKRSPAGGYVQIGVDINQSSSMRDVARMVVIRHLEKIGDCVNFDGHSEVAA